MPAKRCIAALTLFTTLVLSVDTGKPVSAVGPTPIVRDGFGSAMAPVPGTSDEYYLMTDRGPNTDGPITGSKVFPLPDYTPNIGRFKLCNGALQLQKII